MKPTGRALRTVVTLVLAFLPALAGPSAAAASTLYVSPTGNDANNCLSPAFACLTIQAAVNKAADRDTIQVAAGSYAEQVAINFREKLSILGVPGARLTAPGTPEARLISINGSTDISIRGFTLSGPGANATGAAVGGIAINISRVTIADCTVEDMNGGGIVAFNDSFVQITNSLIRRNRYHGFRVDGGSSAVLGSANPAETVVIEDHPYAGLLSGPAGGNVKFRGAVTVQRNAIGILGAGTTFSTCCSEEELPLRILNNATGIRLEGGHLELRVPAVVEGNNVVGLRLVGATAFFGRYAPVGPRIIIRNNGSADNPTAGGIFLTGSHLDIVAADIVDNRSRGVLAQDNSSVRIADSVISGNGAEGVRLESLSTTRLFTGALLGGNSGFDLSCTPESVGSGDSSGVKRMFCPAFDKSSKPTPGGPDRH